MGATEGSSVETKAREAFKLSQLGAADVAVDHADGAASTLIAAAPRELAFIVYVECTEAVTGAVFELGTDTTSDEYDDGTKHGLYDALGESFTIGGTLAKGDALVAEPTTAGTAGAYKYTVISQATGD